MPQRKLYEKWGNGGRASSFFQRTATLDVGRLSRTEAASSGAIVKSKHFKPSGQSFSDGGEMSLEMEVK